MEPDSGVFGQPQPELTHVHAKGQVRDSESYFRSGGTRADYKQVVRSDLKIQVPGGAAVMTGRQLLVAVRKDGGGRVRIDSHPAGLGRSAKIDGVSWRSKTLIS